MPSDEPHYAPIQMIPAEPGWWVEIPDGDVHAVVGWAVARDFSNRKAPNRTVPMVIDSALQDFAPLLAPSGQYRIFFDEDRDPAAVYAPNWSA